MHTLEPYLLNKSMCFNEGAHDFRTTSAAMKDIRGFRAALAENIVREVINNTFKEKVELVMEEYIKELKNKPLSERYRSLLGTDNGLLFFIVDLINEEEKVVVEVKSSAYANLNHFLEQLIPERVRQFTWEGYDYILGAVCFSRNNIRGNVKLARVHHNGMYFERKVILARTPFELKHSTTKVSIKFEKFRISFTLNDIMRSMTKPIGESHQGKECLYTKKELDSIHKDNAYPHKKLLYGGA